MFAWEPQVASSDGFESLTSAELVAFNVNDEQVSNPSELISGSGFESTSSSYMLNVPSYMENDYFEQIPGLLDSNIGRVVDVETVADVTCVAEWCSTKIGISQGMNIVHKYQVGVQMKV